MRGHQVSVLTSRFHAESVGNEEKIYRLLFLENDLFHYSRLHFVTRWAWEEAKNKEIIKNMVNEIRPDLVFIWGMYGFSRNIPAFLEQLMPHQIIYYLSDQWPIEPSFHQMYWSFPAPTKMKRIAKRIMSIGAMHWMRINQYPPRLQFRDAILVSASLRKNLAAAGLPLENSVVVHSGRKPQKFLVRRNFDQINDGNGPIKLLYAGRLGHHKGVHTCIEALSLLQHELKLSRLTLKIVGDGHQDYKSELNQRILDNNLTKHISISEGVHHDLMPQVLEEHDVLIVPSICEDALPGIVQEAMLSGLVIIGSRMGGIPEMVVHEKTGLLFAPEDHHDLADKIRKIINDRQLLIRLAKQGNRKASQEFTSNAMVDKIERHLAQRTTLLDKSNSEISSPGSSLCAF